MGYAPKKIAELVKRSNEPKVTVPKGRIFGGPATAIDVLMEAVKVYSEATGDKVTLKIRPGKHR